MTWKTRFGVTCFYALILLLSQLLHGQVDLRGQQSDMMQIPTSRISSPFSQRDQARNVVYSTNFGADSDIDEDLWPDNWTQFFGEGFPRYAQARIAFRRTPFGSNCLQIPVQRGAVTLFTPRVEILPGLTYVGNARVLSHGLQHNRVFISLSLLDSAGRILQTAISERVVNTDGWTPLDTSPITADHPEADSVSVGVHVIPLDRQDLAGLVELGLVAIAEQPTIHFDKKNPWQLFTHPDEIVVSGHITSSQTSWQGARLEIRDAYSRVLESRPLLERGINFDSNDNPTEVGQYGFYWQPKITQPGYYAVTLSLPLPGIDPVTLEPNGTSRTTSFAFLEPYGTIVNGDFGWSLPDDMSIEQCRRFQPLLETAGISRLKFPIWLAANTPESAIRQYILFGEWLAGRRMQAVGVFASPPDPLLADWQKQMTLVRNGNPVPDIPSISTVATTAAASSTPVPRRATTQSTLDIGQAGTIFQLPPEFWLPSLETTVFRMGMIVHNWQIGRNDDRSLVDFNDVGTLLETIDSQLRRQGYDVSLGLPWDWVYSFPPFPRINNSQRTRGFLSLDNEWPLTVDDLSYYLNATGDSDVTRFVMLNLIDRRQYPLEGRVIDMVRRMIAAKEHGANAVFLARPFDSNFGVYDSEGEPGELFLPWRTTALMISGKQPVGGFNMPRGSESHLFRGPSGTVMAVWNETPTDEALFLGRNSEIIDVWGSKTRPVVENQRQVVSVGPVPVFVTNLHHDVAMIRQNCRLENSDIPSRYGMPIPNMLYFTNTTGEPLNGKLTFVPPEGVSVEPAVIPLKLMVGETVNLPLTIQLNAQAKSGEQMLVIDVQAGMQDAPVFSVYQPINIGGGDIAIDLSTRLNRNDELEVYLALINDGQSPVNFTCTLYIPNRPLQKMQVRNQGFGRFDFTYTIPNGRSLLGKPLRVVAKEVDGQRMLKYELTAKP
ncbi:MAG: hypothetical protein FWD31_01065 [Planctomycetaceae bacterium]|nr:hypothetical protein [Planctomycetaceae bacterium]